MERLLDVHLDGAANLPQIVLEDCGDNDTLQSDFTNNQIQQYSRHTYFYNSSSWEEILQLHSQEQNKSEWYKFQIKTYVYIMFSTKFHSQNF